MKRLLRLSLKNFFITSLLQKCEGKYPDVVFAKVDVDDAEVSVETNKYLSELACAKRGTNRHQTRETRYRCLAARETGIRFRTRETGRHSL